MRAEKATRGRSHMTIDMAYVREKYSVHYITSTPHTALRPRGVERRLAHSRTALFQFWPARARRRLTTATASREFSHQTDLLPAVPPAILPPRLDR